MRWVRGLVIGLCAGMMAWSGVALARQQAGVVREWRVERVAQGEALVLLEDCDLLSLNTADLDALLDLPGIGPVLAQRILEYRDEAEVFVDAWELVRVQGIGDKTYEALTQWVCVCTPEP